MTTLLRWLALALALAAFPLRAQEIVRGEVTNLPIPRYVSLKAGEANVRRGPSLSHRIDWIFTRRDMPLQVVAEFENWRRVVDREGLGGWIHFTLLSGVRTVIVDEEMQPVFSRASEDSTQIALLESGVIARLKGCTPTWCEIDADGYDGWVPKSAIWGVDPEEVLE